ncbi:GPW/gp25 family protein [Alcanivorax sp. S71-1-4]|uniref:GPW/gp25 family protein n=1 Tax=Alcanivorax sp. S71-1-4 TaxID=1177159 RepID=UPI00135B253F|nr:GPW/gp25 family protein [Alcanivorax sp. S71-1-4]KAF0810436.1 GPW/gp25 family protein [Alcanivorax sp. S71-1-4]
MTGMNAYTGKTMPRRDYLQQCIRDVLTTPIGSRVMRRAYGSLLPELIDQPLHGATLLRSYAATATAIMTWVPSVQIQRVLLIVSEGGLVVDIETVENGTVGQLQVPLGLKGAV